MWLWALHELHCFVFFDNAWPRVQEQDLFTASLLKETSHAQDTTDLLSKVNEVVGLSSNIWGDLEISGGSRNIW